MEEKILNYFFNGSNPNEWLLLRIFASFVGGLSAHLIENELRTRISKTRIHFWWRGFWFTFISGLGGLALLRPIDATAAFLAGLMGWYAIINFMNTSNSGIENPKYENLVLTEEEINKKFMEVNQ